MCLRAGRKVAQLLEGQFALIAMAPHFQYKLGRDAVVILFALKRLALDPAIVNAIGCQC
jgi:hypothetical protein